MSGYKTTVSCFLEMARLLLVLTVNGSEFHKTGVALAKARSPSVEQLTFGTNRRDLWIHEAIAEWICRLL